MTKTQELMERVETNKTGGMEQIKFVEKVLQEYERSPEFKLMQKGKAYYIGDHDVLMKQTKLPGGLKAEDFPHIADEKIVYPVYKKIVDQKADFILSNNFEIESDNIAFIKAMEEYLDMDLYNLVRQWTINAENEGISWVRVVLNGKGELKVRPVYGERIVPLWRDEQKTSLHGIIFKYAIQDYTKVEQDGTVPLLTYVDYYIIKETGGYEAYYYVLEDNVLSYNLEPAVGDFKAVVDDEVRGYYQFERLPFIYMKHNKDEMPLIKYLKLLIDAMDDILTGNITKLGQLPPLVAKAVNYGGADPDEFWRNIYKTWFIPLKDNGDAKFEELPLNAEARKIILDTIESLIYKAANAVNKEDQSVSNVSTETYKMMFDEMYRDCSGFATYIRSALDKLFWFFMWDMNRNGKGNFFDVQYDIKFNMNIPMNEKEEIEKALMLNGEVSDEEFLRRIPGIDYAKELEFRKARSKEQELYQQALTEAYQANLESKAIGHEE